MLRSGSQAPVDRLNLLRADAAATPDQNRAGVPPLTCGLGAGCQTRVAGPGIRSGVVGLAGVWINHDGLAGSHGTNLSDQRPDKLRFGAVDAQGPYSRVCSEQRANIAERRTVAEMPFVAATKTDPGRQPSLLEQAAQNLGFAAVGNRLTGKQVGVRMIEQIEAALVEAS